EQAKVRLSVAEDTLINLESADAVLAGKTISVPRQRLEALCLDLVQRTFMACDEVLAKAGVRTADIDAVLLAGGTTYLPMVRTAVAKYFGKTPRFDLPADRLVAIGAALSARS
ncbi:MAG: Hsp70 family protein, partial [Deltaproteobacteria bacterium]|nr:Hsp70 family protein [Deltaproteobacteria bacterium]